MLGQLESKKINTFFLEISKNQNQTLTVFITHKRNGFKNSKIMVGENLFKLIGQLAYIY